MEEKKVDGKKEQFISPKLFFLLVGLLAIWLLFIAFVPQEFKPTDDEQGFLVTFKAMSGEELILNRTIEVDTGANAFDAMQTVASVGYQDFGEMGVMVESINGTKPGENEFWALYVDGEMAVTGITGITFEKDTLIEWKIEGIEDYSG
jgi:hypothetical protein